MNPTCAQVIYDALKRVGEPMNLPRIVLEAGCSENGAQAAIQRMRKAGIVRMVGIHREWEIVPGAKRPQRMTGKSKGSLDALRTYGGGYHERMHPNSLRNLKYVKVDERGNIIRKVKPRHALEQAWGWFASPFVGASSD